MYRWFAGILFCYVLTVWVHLGLRDYICDDAYIHFRVAEHFALYGEPYFNRGEEVASSSSLVWLFLLSFLAFLGLPLTLAAPIMSGSILFASGWVWRNLARASAGKERAGLCGAVVVAGLSYSSVSMMETPLAFFLLGLALLGWHAKKQWSWICFALLPFVRPEMVIFSIVFFLLAAWKGWASYWRAILGAGAVAIPCLGFMGFFYSSVLPHAMKAKSLVYELPIDERIQRLAVSFLNASFAGEVLEIAVAHLLIVTAGLLFAVFQVRKEVLLGAESLEIGLATGALLIMSGYLFMGVLVFPWYAPLYVIPTVLALLFLSERAKDWQLRPLAFVMIVPLILSCFQTFIAGAFLQPAIYPGFPLDARTRALARAVESFDPADTVLAPEIGAVGYYFSGRVVDAVGIASPEALQFHPLKPGKERASGSVGAVPAKLVEWQSPERVIGYELFLEQVLADAEVQDNYAIKRLPPLLKDDRERLGDQAFPFGDLVVLSSR